MLYVICIAGHRHSGILYLSPVPEHSGTGLVPASEFMFIPVPDWLDAEQSDIPAFRKKLLVVVIGYPVHIQTAGSGKWYTLHAHRQLLRVLFLLYDIEKSYVNAGMPEKS